MTVAMAAGDALRRHGIEGVLTGGACASFYTGGSYKSAGADFILTGPVSRDELDAAMVGQGFVRHGDRYTHPRARFFVEFPRGPLAIGGDLRIRPVRQRSAASVAFTLSATDSCRDRLAAFYHWNDRQSLDVAVAIALRHRVRLSKVRAWSGDEGMLDRFEEFMSALRVARARRRRSTKAE